MVADWLNCICMCVCLCIKRILSFIVEDPERQRQRSWFTCPGSFSQLPVRGTGVKNKPDLVLAPPLNGVEKELTVTGHQQDTRHYAVYHKAVKRILLFPLYR